MLSSLTNSTSGLESLIQQYMAIERRPLTTITSQKTALTSKSSLFETVKTKLNSLKNLAKELASTDSDSIYHSAEATSSDTDAITAEADEGAGIGSYIFRVRQLATSTTMRSTASLNTAVSVKSSEQVVSGLNELDTDESWANAGFAATPTGTVSFDSGNGWVTFTLADYSTVDAFLDAVNADANAAVNIYYNEDSDRFVIEKDEPGGTLSIRQSAADGFLTQAKIVTDTADHSYSTNQSGVRNDVLLYQTNFDSALSESDSGSFIINGVTFSWDADNDTLDDIISDINESQANVTAFYDESLDKVTFISNTTGSEEIDFEDVSGTFLGSTLKLNGVTQSVGQDAKYTINSTDSGNEITKSTNSFTLNGLDITLKEVTVANDNYADSGTQAVTVTSSKNIDQIVAKIQSFLSVYNTVSDYLKTQTLVDPATYSRGALAGESLFRTLRPNLNSIMIGVVSSVGINDPATLGELGITFDSSLHASVTNSGKLRDLLGSNPSGVAAFFNSSSGVATRIYDLLDAFTEEDGIIDDRKDIIQDQIKFLDKRVKSLQERLAIKEQNYRTQFTKLQDLMIRVVQQQSLVSNILSLSRQVLYSNSAGY